MTMNSKKSSLAGKLQNLWQQVTPTFEPYSLEDVSREVDCSLARLNLNRIRLICWVIIAVELFCLFFDLFFYNSTMPLWLLVSLEAALIALSAVYLLLIKRTGQCDETNVAYAHRLCRSFWFLFILLCAVCFIVQSLDASSAVIPIGIYVLICIIPLLRPINIVLLIAIMHSSIVITYFLGVTLPNVTPFYLVVLLFFPVGIAGLLYNTTKTQLHSIAYMRQQNTQMERISVTDTLTGLHNRRWLEQQIERLWSPDEKKKQTPVTVIIMDVDFFKEYNDTFGHDEGDRCLKKISSVIAQVFMKQAEAVCRIGGEEFAIIMQNCTQAQLQDMALALQRGIDALDMPSGKNAALPKVTVSLGAVAPQPIGKQTWQNFYSRADGALYQAKKNGRNCLVIVP